MKPRAVVFDFNGTLSDDEALLCRIFCDLFAEHGRPLPPQTYFDRLAGLSDAEIVRTWLGPDHPARDRVIAERIARYRAATAGGASVPERVREAVRHAAARVPVAVVSGAMRAEIAPVLEAAGIAEAIRFVVAVDDVAEGKPSPAGYLRALSLLDDDLRAAEVLALEDTEAGVAAAKGAGMRCIALLGTAPPERLAAADEIVERLDVELMRRLVGA
jgi:beta-phosphoglucomutase